MSRGVSVVAVLLAVSACADSHSVECGTGDGISIGGGRFCLFPSDMEPGECPPEAPHRLVGPDGISCGTSAVFPDEICWRLGLVACPARDGGTPDAGHPEDAGSPHEHHYATLEEAHDDGVAVYFPFPVRHQASRLLLDEGRHSPGFEAGVATWGNSGGAFEDRHGPWVHVGAGSAFAPRLPVTPGRPFTALAIVAGPDVVEELAPLDLDTSTRFRWTAPSTHADEGVIASVAVGRPELGSCPTGVWCALAGAELAGTQTLASIDAAPAVAETDSGAAYVFFVWAEGELAVHLGSSQTARPLSRIPAVGAFNTTWVGPDVAGTPFQAYITSFAIWDRVLGSTEMNAMREMDSELVDGF